MKSIFYPAADRGHVDIDWLNSYHSFSFGHYHDPEKVHFGALRVLNDDYIAGGGGFPTHPHDNMEIVTIPLNGALAHKDSTGTDGIIKTGDVQIMSAGTGIRHSEFNASKTEAVNLLQIWVIPKNRNIKPRYDQQAFDNKDRKNKWQVVVSPDQQNGALWINQDTRFALTDIEAGKEITFTPAFSGNGVYLFVIEGGVSVGDKKLDKRDALGVYDTESVDIKADVSSTVLAIEVPMLK